MTLINAQQSKKGKEQLYFNAVTELPIVILWAM